MQVYESLSNKDDRNHLQQFSWQCLSAGLIAEAMADKRHITPRAHTCYSHRVAVYNPSYINDDHVYLHILDQMHRNKYMIAGLPETGNVHARAGQKRGSYIRYASTRDSSGHACEILFNIAIPYGTIGDQDLYYTTDDINVLKTKSRFISLVVRSKLSFFIVVCMHAPHAQDKANISSWWETAESDILSITLQFPSIPILILADCNARPPSPDGKAIGYAWQHKWSPTTQYFKRF